MEMEKIDALIRVVAEYFTGPDMPLNSTGFATKKGGKFQLHERADRFFKVREELGIGGSRLPKTQKPRSGESSAFRGRHRPAIGDAEGVKFELATCCSVVSYRRRVAQRDDESGG